MRLGSTFRFATVALAFLVVGSEAGAQMAAQRGRPRLNAARTTFVADNGERLRGPYTSTEWTGAVPPINIANVRSLGFNALHLYAEVFDPSYPTNGSPGNRASHVDQIVAATRTNGMYLVMTIGNGANNGNHNLAYATNFWNFYAARYSNETHVIFEIHNEPMAWGPSYLTGTTPAGTMDMEIAAYRAIRARAPHAPVLIFSYAVLSGNGGANAALNDIRAFNQAVFGMQNAVWTNEAVGFHGYGGWDGTVTAVSNLISAGYPCFMTEFGWPRWGRKSGVALELEVTTDLERLGVSWLTFQYVPPTGVSSDVTRPELFKNLVDNAGMSWTPDFGTWPIARGIFGNNGQPRSTVANWVNNFLTGTLRIQAEDFDWGGEGVSCHDTTAANTGGLYRTNEPADIATSNDTGGGHKVTSTEDGEWLEYTILVRQPGYYDLALRYATPNNDCAIAASSAMTDQTAARTLPSTGSHTTWSTASVPVYLAYGRQKLRLTITRGGFDLNWIELSPAATGLVANGTYKFLNAGTALAMQAVSGTNRVVVTNYSGASMQQWSVQHMGGGQYRVLSAANAASWNDTSDVLGLSSSWNTSKERNFIFVPGVSGFHRILPASSGVTLHGLSAAGSIVEQQEYFGSAAQQWAIVSPLAPAFPIGLSATASSATQVALRWNVVSGATGYNVKRATTSGGPYTTVASGITATNFTDTMFAGMKYFYVVSALASGVESANSVEATYLPFPWQSRDIGSVGISGSAAHGSGVFSVGGSGADVWGASDAFHFLYVSASGNFTITARVVSVQNADVWSKAGVMIRESLNANSANAYMAVTPGNGTTFQTRSSAGGNTVNNATGGLIAPYWVRLVRSGNTFSGYRSPDGVNWTQQGSSTTITMASTVYVGVAVTAHDNSELCAATFDNVSAPGWTNPIPTAAPASLTANVVNWSVNLSWATSSGATRYNVKRATSFGGPYDIIANVATTSFSDTSLGAGPTYYYVVSALNAGGESGNSVAASVDSQPLGPSGLSATALSPSEIHLSWNAFLGASSYNVKRSLTSGGPYALITSGVNGTSFTDGELIGGATYHYVVSANVSGGETLNSLPASAVAAVAISPTLISAGASWRYFDKTNDLGTSWRSNNFSDVTWSNGPARLGFGNDGEATKVASNRQWTTYFRREFYVSNPAEVTALNARLTRDDAAVIYLNGAQIWRDANFAAGVITNQTPANTALGSPDETNWFALNLEPSTLNYLQPGWNLLAAEVHNQSLTSSDLGFNFELTADVLLTSLPMVQAVSAGGSLQLSWPDDGTYFRLFSATNMTPPVAWTRATNSPVLINGRWQVTLPAGTNGQRFFSLQQP